MSISPEIDIVHSSLSIKTVNKEGRMDAAVEQDTPASAPHLDGGADIDRQVLVLVAEELRQFPGINSVKIIPQVRVKTADTLEIISFLPKRRYVLGLFLGVDTIRSLKIFPIDPNAVWLLFNELRGHDFRLLDRYCEVSHTDWLRTRTRRLDMPEANGASVQPLDRQGLETKVTELIAQKLQVLHGVKTVELEPVHVKEQPSGVITRSIGLASDRSSVIMRFIGVTIVRVIRIVPSVGTSVTQLQNTIERTRFDPRELIRLIKAGSTSAQAPGAESKRLFALGIRPIAVKIGEIRGVASVEPGEHGVSDSAKEPSEVRVQETKILVKVWFGNNWQILVVEPEAFDGDLEPLAEKIRDALDSEARSDQARSVPRPGRPPSTPPRPPDSSGATRGTDYEVYTSEDVKLDEPVVVSAQQAETYRFLQQRFPALVGGHIVIQGLFRLLETQFPGEGVNRLGGIKGTGLVRSLGRVSGSSQKRFLLVKAEIKTAESAGRIRHKPDEHSRVRRDSPRPGRPPSTPPRPPSVPELLEPDKARGEETAAEAPAAPVRAPAPSSPNSDQTGEDLMSLYHYTVEQRTELLAQGFDVDTNLSHECRDSGCSGFTITFHLKRRGKPGQ